VRCPTIYALARRIRPSPTLAEGGLLREPRPRSAHCGAHGVGPCRRAFGRGAR
jgi:hypothetical protein